MTKDVAASVHQRLLNYARAQRRPFNEVLQYFGLDAKPIRKCILFSQGYGLDLKDLREPRGFPVKAKDSDLRIARWDERTRDDLREPHPSGGLPLVDPLHRLMHLWSAGQLDTVKDYVAEKGLRQNDLFWGVSQVVLEMAVPKSKELTLLEAPVPWGRWRETPAVVQQERPL